MALGFSKNLFKDKYGSMIIKKQKKLIGFTMSNSLVKLTALFTFLNIPAVSSACWQDITAAVCDQTFINERKKCLETKKSRLNICIASRNSKLETSKNKLRDLINTKAKSASSAQKIEAAIESAAIASIKAKRLKLDRRFSELRHEFVEFVKEYRLYHTDKLAQLANLMRTKEQEARVTSEKDRVINIRNDLQKVLLSERSNLNHLKQISYLLISKMKHMEDWSRDEVRAEEDFLSKRDLLIEYTPFVDERRILELLKNQLIREYEQMAASFDFLDKQLMTKQNALRLHDIEKEIRETLEIGSHLLASADFLSLIQTSIDLAFEEPKTSQFLELPFAIEWYRSIDSYLSLGALCSDMAVAKEKWRETGCIRFRSFLDGAKRSKLRTIPQTMMFGLNQIEERFPDIHKEKRNRISKLLVAGRTAEAALEYDHLLEMGADFHE